MKRIKRGENSVGVFTIIVNCSRYVRCPSKVISFFFHHSPSSLIVPGFLKGLLEQFDDTKTSTLQVSSKLSSVTYYTRAATTTRLIFGVSTNEIGLSRPR